MNPTNHDFRELSEITEEHLNFRAIDSGLGFTNTNRSQPTLNNNTSTHTAPRFQTNAKSFEPAATAISPISQPGAPIRLRLSAFFADLCIVLVPWLGSMFWVSKNWDIRLFTQTDIQLFTAFLLISYFLLTESLGGQSLGKMLYKIRTVEDDKYEKPIGFKRAAMRLLALILGSISLGLGLALALIDHKRRPWHDKFSGSIVRQKS